MATVGDRMTSSVLSIDQDESINNAATKIYDNQIGSLLVTQNENFIGIITKTDLMVKVLIKNLDGNSTRVSEVMSQPLITIDADEPLDSAKKIFNEKPIRHLAVTRNDEVVGVLSTKDLR
ncbi:MAG: CBS domain-containing protein [Nitrospinae bacterium]|nr:CBS domain-containing protein [Nitrospinota bacterium]